MNFNKLNNGIIRLLIALIVGTMIFPMTSTQAADNNFELALTEDVRIFFRPANLISPSGHNLNLMIDTHSKQIGFVRIDLSFDSSNIQLVDEIQITDVFRTVVSKTSKASANATGSITLILGTAPGDTAPSGVIEIAKLFFTGAPGYSSQYADISVENQNTQMVDLAPNGLNFFSDPGIVSLYTFEDVHNAYWSWSFIERLYAAGITGGCGTSPFQYCPETTVTRSQMAVFLLRGIHGSAYSPPAMGDSTGFGDVPVDYWSAPWIKQLAAEGITGGCGLGKYCPEYPVTRDQMAVFLLRSKYGSLYSPPAVVGSTGFGDVPVDHWAAPWIKQLVMEGITAGCGSGNYCPGMPVTRAQMAVFLVRTFSLP